MWGNCTRAAFQSAHHARRFVGLFAVTAGFVGFVQQRECIEGAEEEVAFGAYGLPTSHKLRTFSRFMVDFDYQTRNPLWVLEVLDRGSVSGSAGRKQSTFHEDEQIEERFRNKLTDFRRSGYDRGHMAPAADCKGDQQWMNETFNLINMSPQVGKGFNQNYWARFEWWIITLLRNQPTIEKVYVITGPLFLPSRDPTDPNRWIANHKYIGQPPHLVAVPTHFYKVILTVHTPNPGGARYGLAAFVMPNQPIDPNVPLITWSVPLYNLESLAGLRFFDLILSAARMEQIDRAALQWQQAGFQLMEGTPLAPSVRSSAHNQYLMIASSSNSNRNSSSNNNSSSSNSSVSSTAVVPYSKQRADLWKPKMQRAFEGMQHLCDLTECTLPPENFFENNHNQAKDKPGNKT